MTNNNEPNIDVNGLNYPDVVAAIAIGEMNLDAVIPAFRPVLEDRLAKLRDRKRRLEATEARRVIQRVVR